MKPLATLITASVSAGHLHAKPLQVFLHAGQSNLLGRAEVQKTTPQFMNRAAGQPRPGEPSRKLPSPAIPQP